MSGRSGRPPIRVGHLRRLVMCMGLVAATVVIGKPQAQARPAAATPGLRPSLSVAQRDGRDLGAVPAQTQVTALVTLASRDPAGLAALAGGNPHLTAARYATAFGADPGAVASARAALAAAGIGSRWTPGSRQLYVEGHASAVSSFFGVAIHRYVGPDGTRFYARVSQPAVPAVLSAVATSVSGLTDYAVPTRAIPAGGIKPADIRRFYDIQSLLDAGIDGTGITVVFPESSLVDPANFDAFTSKFNLPPMHVTVRTDPAWGSPDKAGSEASVEAEMDVEIVHAVAPGAREVIYAAGSNLVAAEEQAITDDPGGVLSSSLGPCEEPNASGKAEADAFGQVTQHAATTGVTFFDASGDSGAYGCAPPRWGDDGGDLLTSIPNSSPFATSVGGTSAFLAKDSAFFRETCWSSQVALGGSGGGLSRFYSRPSWQTGPGVANQYSNGMRQVPDVAAVADVATPYDIISGGRDQNGDGTSAAAPLWAGVAALIDQDLQKKGLSSIGFANPALYFFGQNSASLPAPPYHDITEGNNLFYPATTGWDYCTGWGTPDVANLMVDFEMYEQQHPHS